jgi:hypothetical protein
MGLRIGDKVEVAPLPSEPSAGDEPVAAPRPPVDELEAHPWPWFSPQRLLATGIDRATESLRPGGRIDFQALGMSGPAVGVGGVSVACTRAGEYELTLLGRVGVGVGQQQEPAQGTALATEGGSVVLPFKTRDALVRGMSALFQSGVLGAGLVSGLGTWLAPWVDREALPRAIQLLRAPASVSLSSQVDGIGFVDHVPIELKGNVTGRMELAVDLRTGVIAQRLELSSGSGVGLMLKGDVSSVLMGKATSYDAALSSVAQMALETRFQGPPDLLGKIQRGEASPSQVARSLIGLKPLEGRRIVGALQLGARGIHVTASRTADVDELIRSPGAWADFFDPQQATFQVQTVAQADLTLAAGAGPFQLKLIGATTEPLFEVRDVAYSGLRRALLDAAEARSLTPHPLDALRAAQRAGGG